MTLLSHHAHIFIGDPKTSKEVVFEYFKKEGIDFHAEVNQYVQETNVFTIEDARNLKRFVSEKSLNGGQSFVVVFTENFSHPAQHALLKTLEEPGFGLCIVFVTPREHTLLSTLKSRVLLHYLEVQKIPSPIPPSIFEKANTAKKISLVDEYLKKVKNDDSQDIKREVTNFLNAYEEYLHENGGVQKYIFQFEAIFFAKEYLHDQGSSAKQLLEYIALH